VSTSNLPRHVVTHVIDASVAVKWFLTGEEHSAQAQALLANSLRRSYRLVGPPLLIAEATNAIYQRFRRGDVGESQVDAAVESLWDQEIHILNPADLTERAYRFVRRHRLANVYDSHYVVLAQELGAEFWTGDQRMFNSLHTVAPWVRWLGDYVPEDDDV
jgi:predicted nucleic acid-binding protein